MIWTEKYRPKTLKDFIGNAGVVKVADNWMNKWKSGTPMLQILILHGRSGIGKTTLAHCLAEHHGCAVSEMNASDERNVANIKRAIQTNGIRGIDSKRRLTILDEADSISKSAQKVLVSKIKLVKQPMIMLVNDMDKIIPELKNISLKLEMKKPTEMQRIMFAKEIIELEHLEPWDLKKVIETSESFRDILHLLYFDTFGDDFKDDVEGNKMELITAMLQGTICSDVIHIAPDELLRFVYQNKNHSILRDVDVCLRVANDTKNYRPWAYAFAILELQRFRGVVRRPKNEFKAKPHSTNDVKIDKTPRPIVKKVHSVNTIKPKSKGLFSHM